MYSHVTELAQVMQIHATIIGSPVSRTDILLPRYSTKKEPMAAPKRRPSGKREAIQDACLCVTGNVGSSLVNCAK